MPDQTVRWPSTFTRLVESFGLTAQLAEDRANAWQKRIRSPQIGAGQVTALVKESGSRPWEVRIGMQTWAKADWTSVLGALAEDPAVVSSLLEGTLPDDVEQVLADAGVTLFPSALDELSLDCTCQDTRVPCDHLNAVFALLVQRILVAPLTILTLRGRDPETVLAELRNRQGPTEDARLPGQVPPLAEVQATFYDHGQAPGLGDAPLLRGPQVGSEELLDQLPAGAITVDGVDLAVLLRPAYRALGAHP